MAANVKVWHYEAFSRTPGHGNPAGVVWDAEGLSDADMQRIAEKVGFNETTFVLASDKADVRLRYFTPGHEMDLCGHATVATLFGMKEEGRFDGRDSILIETKAGVLPIEFKRDEDGALQIRMKQGQPRFVPFLGSRDKLMRSMGLVESDLHPDLPIVYGSTGIWTLLVPIRYREAFNRMVPDNRRFPELLADMPRASVHPFGLDTDDPDAYMHARHFSSPYSGTVEDPATGTASGVMGAYALEYMKPGASAVSFTVEQGIEIGRNGRVKVEAVRTSSGQTDVHISGAAVKVRLLDL